MTRAVFPDLARFAHDANDLQIERAIRHGVRPDGTSLLLMPSAMLYFLDDADLSDLIAYLRSLPPGPAPLPVARYGPFIRLLMVTGTVPFSANGIDHTAPRFLRSGTPDSADVGRYLAHTVCSECHGANLHGGASDPNDPTPPPDLAIVRSYSLQDFSKLMNTGVGLGGRKLGPLMTLVGTQRTPHLTSDEVSGLYSYLSNLKADSQK
jgi:mono/diheme cytochrome c family protein